METYLLVNVFFLSAVLLLFGVPKIDRTQWMIGAILLVMTAVFDSIIVGLHIVGYNSDKILGLYIGTAPIEDFFYAIFAALIVPILWNKLGKYTHAKSK